MTVAPMANSSCCVSVRWWALGNGVLGEGGRAAEGGNREGGEGFKEMYGIRGLQRGRRGECNKWLINLGD